VEGAALAQVNVSNYATAPFPDAGMR